MFGWPRLRNTSPLDVELLHWARGELFSVRDLLSGGVLVIGRAGSGKTSSSGALLGRAIIGHPNSCGLICAAKPEDVTMWQAIFARAGRSEDLLIFNTEGELRFNFLDEVVRYGGGTREVTRCLTTIAESLGAGSPGGNEDGDFWAREQERMLYNAVEVFKLAQVKIAAPELQRFIVTAAVDPAKLNDPQWKDQFHSRCLEAAHGAPKSALEAHDWQLAADYWLSEFPPMADRTRSSIMTGVLGLLHTFNTSLVRELVSTTTNVCTDDILMGRKWVLVDVPPARFGDMGTLINTGWKYLVQRQVLRRAAGEHDPFVVIWCDEAAQFVNKHDTEYITQCRSHLGCLVFLAQSLHSFYAALPGPTGQRQADALLTNFGHRIFHACGDAVTAEWASGMIGDALETMVGGSVTPGQDLFDEVMGWSGYTGSFNQQYQPEVRPHEFMNGLRTGGPHNNYQCDAIVIRSGEPFRCGQNWLRVAFNQR